MTARHDQSLTSTNIPSVHSSMASGPSHIPHNQYGSGDDLIDPDDADLNDLDDPLESAPLTSNSQTTRNPLPQNYLNDTIQGEDRRAPINTIDESVWDTLSRDLRASWLKMKLILWPKHLFGGLLQREGGLGGIEQGQGVNASNITEGFRGIASRIQDTDALLQSSMSEELRDWDLWGPLVFSMLLSLLLSWRASEKQKEAVFTGVFSIVWLGCMVVTWQIRLLGGRIAFFQTVCIIGYTLFPLVIAATLSAFGLTPIARIPIYLVLLLWSFAAGVSILGGSGVVKNRVILAGYPLFVYYVGLGTICFIS